MKTKGATAEVFFTAFKTLPKMEQDLFFAKLMKEKRLREDLIDLSIAESRAKDKGRPFRDFLKEQKG